MPRHVKRDDPETLRDLSIYQRMSKLDAVGASGVQAHQRMAFTVLVGGRGLTAEGAAAIRFLRSYRELAERHVPTLT